MIDRSEVTILMRTKERLPLLLRALRSVLAQTHPHWRLILVNDGGRSAPVDALIERFASDWAGRIRVVHNDRSLGMEGASAVGLKLADGDYIAVHDDDDSWAPDFLALSLSKLQRTQLDFPTVEGVASYCNRVWERVEGQTTVITSVESFNGWAPPGLVSLDRLLESNFIPPISFVFSQLAFDRLDRTYERIPYLGDWDFLVRFLSNFDIMMLPRYLSFYHWRDTPDTTDGNSVIAQLDRHKMYRRLLLNEWLRADLAAGRFGVGAYANLRANLPGSQS